MTEPDRKKIKILLQQNPWEWETVELATAWVQLKDLYEHWYREELKDGD